jgi:hypothetical protein
MSAFLDSSEYNRLSMKKILAIFILSFLAVSASAQHWVHIFSYNDYLGLQTDSVLIPPQDTTFSNPTVGMFAIFNGHVYQRLSTAWSQVDGGGNAVQSLTGSQSIQYGAYSAMPTPGTPGRYYAATDSSRLYFDNGVSWLNLSGSGGGGGGGSALPAGEIWIGNGSNVAQAFTVTGDFGFSSSGVGTLNSNVVTNAKAAQGPANTIKGNNTGSTANEQDLTISQVNTMLATVILGDSITFYVAPTQLTTTIASLPSLYNDRTDPASDSVLGTLTGGSMPVRGIKDTSTDGSVTFSTIANAHTVYTNFHAAGSGGTPANPTGTVGLSAVNGSLASYMRSDAAPPLSQAITPTWSNLHIFGGGLQLNSNITFGTTATYQIGGSTDVGTQVWTRSINSDGQLTQNVPTGATHNLEINGVTDLELLNTGQLNLSKYLLTSSFSGTPVGQLDFDASGNILTGPIGGGGGTTLTRQSITSGTTATGSTPNLLVTFNFSTTASTFTFTMPSGPTDQQTVEFEGGGTLTTGTEVTTLTVSPNTSQSIIGAVTLNTFNVGEYAKYKWNNSLLAWMREN